MATFTASDPRHTLIDSPIIAHISHPVCQISFAPAHGGPSKANHKKPPGSAMPKLSTTMYPLVSRHTQCPRIDGTPKHNAIGSTMAPQKSLPSAIQSHTGMTPSQLHKSHTYINGEIRTAGGGYGELISNHHWHLQSSCACLIFGLISTVKRNPLPHIPMVESPQSAPRHTSHKPQRKYRHFTSGNSTSVHDASQNLHKPKPSRCEKVKTTYSGTTPQATQSMNAPNTSALPLSIIFFKPSKLTTVEPSKSYKALQSMQESAGAKSNRKIAQKSQDKESLYRETHHLNQCSSQDPQISNQKSLPHPTVNHRRISSHCTVPSSLDLPPQISFANRNYLKSHLKIHLDIHYRFSEKKQRDA